MKYWLAINSNPLGKGKLEANPNTYWCLPEEASPEDEVFMYCPRSASAKWQGIYSICRVDRVGHRDQEQYYRCRGYAYKKQALLYSELTRTQIYDKHLQATEIKSHSKLRLSNFARRNFQGTVFELSEDQQSTIRALLEDLNA